jgi:Zn-dependent protease with chaperone function
MENTLAAEALLTEPADKNIIKPSKQFNKEVLRSLNAISVFILVYILLFLAAVACAILFGVVGIALITVKIHWVTIALGLGLIFSGLMLVYFLIKFLFKRSGTDQTGLYEITEEQQPRLFEFIRALTQETGTDFPKHIYLSPEVNAAVFYNSSFWSMFFPVKKNLKIGLGLVNSLNQSEFKAVLAHEFGHFSQRSMKFGSYVYNLNKIIYNILYDNESYGNIIEKWAGIHTFFRATAWLNVKIIQGIQFILQKLYVYLNKSHMRLSRQMEFHADAIAAYVGGSNNAIAASRRIDIGQICYNWSLDYLNGELKNNKKAENIYPQHAEVIKYFATSNNIGLDVAALPVVDTRIAVLNNQQVVIEDQWSSHPSSEDREEALEKISIIKPTVKESAWQLFNDTEALQQFFTDQLYETVTTDKPLEKMDLAAFKQAYYKNIDANSYSNIYKGYYNYRIITHFNIDEAITKAETTPVLSFSELFTDENSNLPKAVSAMQTDVSTVEAIINQQVDSAIKTFDFRGAKYYVIEANYVKEVLTADIAEAQQKIEKLDEQLFMAFYAAGTSGQKETLANYYRTVFAYQNEDKADYDRYEKIITAFNPVYNTMPYDEIERTVKQVYQLEVPLKVRLQFIVQSELYKPYITEEQQKAVDTYLSQKWAYFVHPNYDNDAINVFAEGTSAYINIVAERTFQQKKQLLAYQLQILE